MTITLVRVVEFFEQKSIHPRDIIPSFELLNIVSLMRKVCEFNYFDNEVLNYSSKKMLEVLLRDTSDVYIFHVQPIALASIARIVRTLKSQKRNVTCIVFGPSIEYSTRSFLVKSKADYAVIGEVELTVHELLRRFMSGNGQLKLSEKESICGLAFISDRKYFVTPVRSLLDPDDLPYMAHEFVDPVKYKVVSKIIKPRGKIRWGFILSSRGCPYSCIFCSPSIRNSIGKNYRCQSSKRTVDEMQYLIDQYQVNAISFEDDLFTLDRDRVIRICKEIIKRKFNISWTAATRLDCLDVPMLRLMKRAGCTGMSLGVESGSERILKLVNKGETLVDIKTGIQMMHQVGIAPTINLIIGHPTETVEDLNATLQLAKQLKPAFIHLHFLTPYPGTEIYNIFRDRAKDFQALSHWRIHQFNVTAVSYSVLKGMMKKMYLSYYFNVNYMFVYVKYRLAYWIHDPIFEMNFLIKTVIYLCSQSSDEIKG